MIVDKALNLVVPVERTDGTTVYVHSTPISREVFDQFYLVIAKTFASMYTQGLGMVAGPRVAAKLLRTVATDMGPAQLELVQNGLFAEMKRLSNVIVPGETGWVAVPLHDAVARKIIDVEDADEVDNAITFFMLVSAMHKKQDAKAILAEAVQLWGAQITSSTSTGFLGSLPTSMPTAVSGATAPQSFTLS